MKLTIRDMAEPVTPPEPEVEVSIDKIHDKVRIWARERHSGQFKTILVLTQRNGELVFYRPRGACIGGVQPREKISEVLAP